MLQWKLSHEAIQGINSRHYGCVERYEWSTVHTCTALTDMTETATATWRDEGQRHCKMFTVHTCNKQLAAQLGNRTYTAETHNSNNVITNSSQCIDTDTTLHQIFTSLNHIQPISNSDHRLLPFIRWSLQMFRPIFLHFSCRSILLLSYFSLFSFSATLVE